VEKLQKSISFIAAQRCLDTSKNKLNSGQNKSHLGEIEKPQVSMCGQVAKRPQDQDDRLSKIYSGCSSLLNSNLAKTEPVSNGQSMLSEHPFLVKDFHM
jgi:hypothetical protein